MTKHCSESKDFTIPSWLLLLCLLISFVGIANRGLWTPDEPRVAAISAQMVQSGNIVVPMVAGEAFVEKPPLYFAFASVFLRVFKEALGVAGAVRLSTAVWGLLTLAATFLFAKKLFDVRIGLVSVLLLSTMLGFVENFHWIRVDAALCFFIAAAMWSFAEFYLENARFCLILGGVFTAGAFLSKGIIGPVLVAVAWLGFFLPWLLDKFNSKQDRCLFIFSHLGSFMAFIAVSGLWVLLLRHIGGEELFNEWFWDNHVGRASGTATHLGHLRPGKPFYYLGTLLFYSLPWLPLIPVWLYTVWKRRADKAYLAKQGPILTWGFGILILLSIPVTKRDIYLAPALPAFSVMAAIVFCGVLPRWISKVYGGWMLLCLAAMVIVCVFPIGCLINTSLKTAISEWLLRTR